GGTLAILSCITRKTDVDGVILSSPFLPGSLTASGFWGKMLFPLARIAPRLPLFKPEVESISREPEVVARYKADPFIYHGRIRVGFVAALRRALSRIDRDAAQFDKPVLILNGSGDRYVSADASRRFQGRIASEDVTMRVYEGPYHEVFNDRERGRVIRDVADWLDARVEAATKPQQATA